MTTSTPLTREEYQRYLKAKEKLMLKDEGTQTDNVVTHFNKKTFSSSSSEDESSDEDTDSESASVSITLSDDDYTTSTSSQSDGSKKRKGHKALEKVKMIFKKLKKRRYANPEDEEYFHSLVKTQRDELVKLEDEIYDMGANKIPLRFQILQSNIDDKLKALCLKKLDQLDNMTSHSDEYYKLLQWVESVAKLPIGKFKSLPINNTDDTNTIATFLSSTRQALDNNVYGHKDTKEHIVRLLAKWISNKDAKGLVIGLEGPMGTGKCHGIDTPILMYDGSIKMVQDIEVGDVVMGDDSTPRNVLALGRGQDEMYEIKPVKGESYTVNSEHILCLKQSGSGCVRKIKQKNRVAYKAIRFDKKTRTFKHKYFDTMIEARTYLQSFSEENNIVEIPVKTYLNLSNHVRKNWLKGYKKGVEFPHQNIDFDPYIVGVWLGDGTTSKPEITNQESKLLQYLRAKLKQYGLGLTLHSEYKYYIGSDTKNGKNMFLDVLQRYNLLNNKHIPKEYLINDRPTRLNLLAGLIDTNGYYANNRYEVIQKNEVLANDILFLTRSLGYASFKYQCTKGCTYKGKRVSGTYYKIAFYGQGLEEIPVKVTRKIGVARQQSKNALVTGIDVVPKGRGDYYGFTLDGNNRYILGDFTVTHNTSLCLEVCNALGLPSGIVSLGGLSSSEYLLGHSYTYEGSKWGKIAEILMHAEYSNPVLFFDELDKVSTSRHGEEIINTLIHITDVTQNHNFRDKYFSEVPLDLSRCIIIFSYNNGELVNPILKDRMVTIKASGYSQKDKIEIAKKHMIPKILQEYAFQPKDLVFDDSILTHIISITEEEDGVRKLKRSLEDIVSNMNVHRLLNKPLRDGAKPLVFPLSITEQITKQFVAKKTVKDSKHLMMYI